jgi:hypothetical protein
MSSWPPPKSKTRNGAEYNLALKKRGSLSIWFVPEIECGAVPSRRRGRQQAYRGAAITSLPDLLNQISPDQELGSVTADGAYDTRKCHDAIAARDAHARAIVFEPMAHKARSDRVRMQSSGNRRATERLRVTTRSMRNDIWDAPSGNGGADITAEVASKRSSHRLQANDERTRDALYETPRPIVDGEGL